MRKADIQWMNQFGEWRDYKSVTILGGAVKQALQQALRLPGAQKARALQDGLVIDIEMK